MTRPASKPPVAVHLVLPGSVRPWTATGLTVRRGDRVTLLGSGRINWGDGHGGAKYHLWGRVPGGRIFGCTQDTATVVADRSGPLELCVYLGCWADASGTLAVGHDAYGPERGSLDVTVLHWPRDADPVDGLATLPDGMADPALARAERSRLQDPVVPPAGWNYLLDVGPGDIFRHAAADGRPAIEVHCHDDAGVLEKDVDVELTAGTTVEWSWRVETLPGRGPENTPWSHDLLGVSAVLDDGPGARRSSSITWFWSTTLEPEDDTFVCPARAHVEHAAHVPVRRGAAGLGRWRRETRDVWSDHGRFVGPSPARLASLRLVAVSHFGHGTGRAAFRDVVLNTAGRRIQVL
ncbi:hypothetical protein GCM10009609_53370 [Pseudonocardia aurantiaca]|uniref:DUF3047 domain-containing protein n=1 Tax=Pseudonocardia aurantiaca TaxID=75290 RepID=A0ABW4FVC9_9PSEU